MKTVTAAIGIEKGKILIAKRMFGDRLEGKWEFPGGKLEENETPQECLKREIREELGVEIIVGPFFEKSIYKYEFGTIELMGYYIDFVEHDFRTNVHEEIRWVELSDLVSYDFSPADIPFVKKLMEMYCGK